MQTQRKDNHMGGDMQNQRISDPVVEPGMKSTIAAGMTVKGDIQGDGELRLAGMVEGNITLNGTFFILKSGELKGEATAEHVIIEGKLAGKIRAKGRIEIRSEASVLGHIVCQGIAIAEGAYVDGEVKTHNGETLQPKIFQEKRKEQTSAAGK